MKILAVEDDKAQRLWLKKKLSEAGHKVRADVGLLKNLDGRNG